MSHQRADILLHLPDGAAKAITKRQATRLEARGTAERMPDGSMRLRGDDYRVNAAGRSGHGSRPPANAPWRPPLVDHNLLFYPRPDAFRPRPQFHKEEEA